MSAGDVFLQLAWDAYRREYGREPVAGDLDAARWLQGYMAAMRDATADRQTQAPGLIALLLDMVDDQRRKIGELERK